VVGLGESSLVTVALEVARCCYVVRLHDNQPGTRGTRGLQQEATAPKKLEVPVDRRRWHDEWQRNNQLDKRCKRGVVRGGSVMRGGGAGGWEGVA
jgi:hypothetical protein